MSRYSQNAKDRHLTTHAHVLTKIDMTQPTRNLSCNNFPDTSHIYCQTFSRCHGNEGTLKSIHMLVAKYTCTTQERRLNRPQHAKLSLSTYQYDFYKQF